MDTTAYTQHPEIQHIISEIRLYASNRPGGLQVSDIRDAAGHQYVDVVMEGGGTLGVALLGYLYVLEEMGIRFLQLAGTSAGSIVAMLLAGGGPIADAKSEWLIEKVAGKDFYDFVDGDEEVRRFVDALLAPDTRKAKKARYTAKVLDDLQDHYGLCPGQHFHDWMRQLLAEKGVHTLDDLRQKRRPAPVGIQNIATGAACPEARWARVSVVAAEVTTGTKVALPDLAHLYWATPGLAHPADFVRASMSIPAFFYPFIVKDLPESPAAREAWDEAANYRGPIPPQAYFVDGGAMSNFPISLFYDPAGLADAPVFGIKIGVDRDSYNTCDSFGSFASAVLGSMMSFHDNDFMVQHPEFNEFVGAIDAGPYNWLDFQIPDAGKIDLFVRGARAARDFLTRFDWESMKALRAAVAGQLAA
jgi:NTE family protein